MQQPNEEKEWYTTNEVEEQMGFQPNFFHFAKTFEVYKGWSIVMLAAAEFMAAFLAIYTALILDILWTEPQASHEPGLMRMPPAYPHTNPAVILSIAIVSSAVLFFTSIAYPGATGHPILAVEQFFLELYSFGRHPNRFPIFSGCVAKLAISICFQVSGATGAAYLAEYSVSEEAIKAHVNFREDWSPTGLKLSVIEGVVFFFFVWVFDRFHRISPRGHKPYATTQEVYLYTLSTGVVGVAQFICVVSVFGTTGSTLNFLLPFASTLLATSVNKSTAATRMMDMFRGEVIAMIVAFVFNTYMFISIAMDKPAVVRSEVKSTTEVAVAKL